MAYRCFSSSKEMYLGYKVREDPELGIFVPKNKTWCNNITTDVCDSEVVVKSFNPTWKAFEHHTDWYPQLENLDNVKQYFDTVCLTVNPTAEPPYEFGIYIDNEKNSKHASVIHVYSHREEEIIFDGFAVRPGKKDGLLRYSNTDRALSLTKNLMTVNTSKLSSKKMFDISCKNNVATLTIVVTRGKLVSPPPVLTTRGGGLQVATDGVDGGGGNGVTYHYANLEKGNVTHQRFTNLDIVHDTSCPIIIYNIVFCLR